LEFSVSGIPENKTLEVVVFGEFRSTGAKGLFTVGENVSRLTELGDKIMYAEFARRSTDHCHYVVRPRRKWHYPGQIRRFGLHVVQFYVAVDGRIQTTTTSTAFQVVFIWNMIGILP